MRRKGKSFWLASLMLPREVAANAARLYSFCRAMDDLADESIAASGLHTLASTLRDLHAASSDDPVLADFLDLAAKHRLPLEPAILLVDTLMWDARGVVAVETEEQLLRYCFGAAGTVGMLMCPLLGCQGQEATEYAVHLGIAMQLTNIARDVLEDAVHGRRYLPSEWGCAYSPKEIALSEDPATVADMARHLERILAMADAYYASAAEGFAMIPKVSRGAIRIAAAVYREIGQQLRTRGMRWKQGRTIVPTRQRIAIALRVWLGGRGVEGCSKRRPEPTSIHRLAALPRVTA
jgi:phytoene synthase